LGVRRLRGIAAAAGRTVERRTSAEEVCLVLLEGFCNVSARDYELRDIGGRDTVFERPPYAVYLPPGTDYTVEADSYLYWRSVRRRRRVASSLSWYVPKR
jgi:5-deoxy-D-glucuronate isomerase